LTRVKSIFSNPYFFRTSYIILSKTINIYI
jgi:hypothetical protein